MFCKTSLLSLAIILAGSVSAQNTDKDTIRFLYKTVVIENVKTNAKYFQNDVSDDIL